MARRRRGKEEEACDVCGVRVIVARHQRGRERERGILVVRRGVISLGCKRRLVFFSLVICWHDEREFKAANPSSVMVVDTHQLELAERFRADVHPWAAEERWCGDGCVFTATLRVRSRYAACEGGLPYCIYKALSHI